VKFGWRTLCGMMASVGCGGSIWISWYTAQLTSAADIYRWGCHLWISWYTAQLTSAADMYRAGIPPLDLLVHSRTDKRCRYVTGGAATSEPRDLHWFISASRCPSLWT
jgi:hypothetical protein